MAAVTSESVGRRLVGFLADLRSAWAVATATERNRLARQLFAEAIVENRTVVAVKPRPELLPFFEAVKWCVGGSDGGRFSVFYPRVRRRAGSCSRLPAPSPPCRSGIRTAAS